MLGGYVVDAVVPFGLLEHFFFESLEFEGLYALLAGANVNAVAAAEAVEHVNALNEAHAVEYLADCGDGTVVAEGCLGHFVGGEHERTDGGVGADERTLVTLNAVCGIPVGNVGCNAAFFIFGGALFPDAVGAVNEVLDGQGVAVLGVDGANNAVNEFGVVVGSGFVVGQRCPCGIDCELLVFAAAVNCCIVLVNDVLALLAI